MTIVTIPKDLAKKGDLVLVPRKEYEEFLSFRLRNIREIRLTPAQKRALEQAKKNLARGKFLTIDELRKKLGITS